MEPKEKYQASLDKVLSVMASGELPVLIARHLLEGGNKPMDSWSFCNQMICLCCGTTDARGFRQWQEVGRQVKKGSKAFHILAPRMVKDKENEDEKIRVGWLSIPVFRYEDTEGADILYPDFTPPQPPPLIEVAQEWHVSVTYDYIGGNYGHFVHSKWNTENPGRIVLASHDEVVFFHELAHAAQKQLGIIQQLSKPAREISAELTAAVLGELYGCSMMPVHRAYIGEVAQKIGQDAHAACLSVLAVTEKMLTLLLKERTSWKTTKTCEENYLNSTTTTSNSSVASAA